MKVWQTESFRKLCTLTLFCPRHCTVTHSLLLPHSQNHKIVICLYFKGSNSSAKQSVWCWFFWKLFLLSYCLFTCFYSVLFWLSEWNCIVISIYSLFYYLSKANNWISFLTINKVLFIYCIVISIVTIVVQVGITSKGTMKLLPMMGKLQKVGACTLMYGDYFIHSVRKHQVINMCKLSKVTKVCRERWGSWFWCCRQALSGSVMHNVQAYFGLLHLFDLPWKPFSFKNLFFSLIALIALIRNWW